MTVNRKRPSDSLWAKSLSVSALALSTAFIATGTVQAQSSTGNADERTLDQVVIVGSRSGKPRSVTDSPVPVDTISEEDLASIGNGLDLTDNLKALVPSYTATPATGDGSAFIRPTSLRGLAPDQTLVLVNGKRRHRSALVQLFAPAAGNGAHGPDVGMIPGIALQRVEVLRDGASSQYGADAIAGVINFVTKDASEGGELSGRYGQFYEGEQSYQLAGNVGFGLGENGYLNISAEYTDNEGLSRGIQRADGQALIDAGVIGVGSDTPFDDEPFVQSWGRPETKGLRTFLSGGFELSENAELYFFGNYADTEGRYRFFYRNPSHPTIQTLRGLGFTGLEGGYTPFLDGNQTDMSFYAGVSGQFDNDISYDVSAGIGSNELDYFLNNSLNPSLGLIGGQPAQRNFDVGALEQEELTVNADFSVPVSDALVVSFGAEYRDETFSVSPGEPNSFQGDGSNGFGGFKPEDSGTFSRDNYAVYIDAEYDLSDDWLVQGAVRFEDFSDFGQTTNWKIASRYNLTDRFAIRGAVSTGFHAPTPGQSNLRSTITTFDGTTGTQTLEGLVPPTSDLALAVGGAPLKEEESTNFSVGFTSQLGGAGDLTVDFYQIEVEDRIYRTGDIPHPTLAGSTISFYTNALDIETRGIDVVLSSVFDFADNVSTRLSLAANYGMIEVTGQSLVGGIQPVSAAIIEDIENNYPELRFVLSTNTEIGDKWNLLLRANYYGEHYDERGTIGAATNPSAQIGSTVYFDTELSYDWNENLQIALGAVNVFDQFVDEIGPPNANRLSVGLQYPRRSAANYDGGSWYLRTRYRF